MTQTTPILKKTPKATHSSKQLAQTAVKKDEELSQVVPTKARIQTVLVASYGWPTDAMLPSRKQAARR